jgi:hypothetical protein
MSLSNAPWIAIAPAQTTGPVWRITEVRHMTGEENQGRHNIFIWLYRDGVLVHDGLSIMYGWAGQKPDEAQAPKLLDKKPPDPSTDIAIETGMHTWVEVVDPHGYPSDRVSNLHAEMVSDGPGNEYHHNSYYVRFDLVKGSVPPPVGNDELTNLRAKIASIKALVSSW